MGIMGVMEWWSVGALERRRDAGAPRPGELAGGGFEGGHGVGGHSLHINTFDGSHADFVGGEIDVATGLDAGLETLAERPVGEVAKEGEEGGWGSGGFVRLHDAGPADGIAVEGSRLRALGGAIDQGLI